MAEPGTSMHHQSIEEQKYFCSEFAQQQKSMIALAYKFSWISLFMGRSLDQRIWLLWLHADHLQNAWHQLCPRDAQYAGEIWSRVAFHDSFQKISNPATAILRKRPDHNFSCGNVSWPMRSSFILTGWYESIVLIPKMKKLQWIATEGIAGGEEGYWLMNNSMSNFSNDRISLIFIEPSYFWGNNLQPQKPPEAAKSQSKIKINICFISWALCLLRVFVLGRSLSLSKCFAAFACAMLFV